MTDNVDKIVLLGYKYDSKEVRMSDSLDSLVDRLPIIAGFAVLAFLVLLGVGLIISGWRQNRRKEKRRASAPKHLLASAPTQEGGTMASGQQRPPSAKLPPRKSGGRR